MNAEIIGIGSELLLGQIVNTDAQFLSQQLSFMGIDVYWHSSRRQPQQDSGSSSHGNDTF